MGRVREDTTVLTQNVFYLEDASRCYIGDILGSTDAVGVVESSQDPRTKKLGPRTVEKVRELSIGAIDVRLTAIL